MTTHLDERGVSRQNHYGEGRQAFDDILDAGWGPAFVAGNILKYLRRAKAPEHSLESARWYYARLGEIARGELVGVPFRDGDWPKISAIHASSVQVQLEEMLTPDELNQLRGDTDADGT